MHLVIMKLDCENTAYTGINYYILMFNKLITFTAKKFTL